MARFRIRADATVEQCTDETTCNDRGEVQDNCSCVCSDGTPGQIVNSVRLIIICYQMETAHSVMLPSATILARRVWLEIRARAIVMTI